MKTLLLLALSAALGFGQAEPDQITVLKLQLQQAQAQSMESWCEMWAEKYKVAQRLPEKQWVEFQKTAPRTIGDADETYEEHFRHQAKRYKAEAEAATQKLRELAKAKCGEKTTIITLNGELQCVSY